MGDTESLVVALLDRAR